MNSKNYSVLNPKVDGIDTTYTIPKITEEIIRERYNKLGKLISPNHVKELVQELQDKLRAELLSGVTNIFASVGDTHNPFTAVGEGLMSANRWFFAGYHQDRSIKFQFKGRFFLSQGSEAFESFRIALIVLNRKCIEICEKHIPELDVYPTIKITRNDIAVDIMGLETTKLVQDFAENKLTLNGSDVGCSAFGEQKRDTEDKGKKSTLNLSTPFADVTIYDKANDILADIHGEKGSVPLTEFELNEHEKRYGKDYLNQDIGRVEFKIKGSRKNQGLLNKILDGHIVTEHEWCMYYLTKSLKALDKISKQTRKGSTVTGIRKKSSKPSSEWAEFLPFALVRRMIAGEIIQGYRRKERGPEYKPPVKVNGKSLTRAINNAYNFDQEGVVFDGFMGLEGPVLDMLERVVGRVKFTKESELQKAFE